MVNPMASKPVKPIKGHQLSERFADADLVDRIFAYIVEQLPELAGRAPEVKAAVREEFAGIETYVCKRPGDKRQILARQVLSMFNGRNASEVARRLDISRATVYRLLKQPAKT